MSTFFKNFFKIMSFNMFQNNKNIEQLSETNELINEFSTLISKELITPKSKETIINMVKGFKGFHTFLTGLAMVSEKDKNKEEVQEAFSLVINNFFTPLPKQVIDLPEEEVKKLIDLGIKYISSIKNLLTMNNNNKKIHALPL